MLRRLHRSRLVREERGAALMEFGFIAPILALVFIGIIDIGRVMLTAAALDHAAREGTRYASAHGADSPAPASEAEIAAFVRAHAVGVDREALAVAVSWDPNNGSGSTVTVQLGYPMTFILTGFLALEPIEVHGASSMVVF